MRIKEQETRLTLQEHGDYDYDDESNNIFNNVKLLHVSVTSNHHQADTGTEHVMSMY